MTAREELHLLVDRLDDEAVPEALAVLQELTARRPTVLDGAADSPEGSLSSLDRALAAAPLEDEPISEEEERAVEEARRAIARGAVISDAELRRRLGL